MAPNSSRVPRHYLREVINRSGVLAGLKQSMELNKENEVPIRRVNPEVPQWELVLYHFRDRWEAIPHLPPLFQSEEHSLSSQLTSNSSFCVYLTWKFVLFSLMKTGTNFSVSYEAVLQRAFLVFLISVMLFVCIYLLVLKLSGHHDSCRCHG